MYSSSSSIVYSVASTVYPKNIPLTGLPYLAPDLNYASDGSPASLIVCIAGSSDPIIEFVPYKSAPLANISIRSYYSEALGLLTLAMAPGLATVLNMSKLN